MKGPDREKGGVNLVTPGGMARSGGPSGIRAKLYRERVNGALQFINKKLTLTENVIDFPPNPGLTGAVLQNSVRRLKRKTG